jgi:hypothetical protein
MQVQRACHDTLPWLIYVSLDLTESETKQTLRIAKRISTKHCRAAEKCLDIYDTLESKRDFPTEA